MIRRSSQARYPASEPSAEVDFLETQAKELAQAANHIASSVFEREDNQRYLLRDAAFLIEGAMPTAARKAGSGVRQHGRYSSAERIVSVRLSLSQLNELAKAASHAASSIFQSEDNQRYVLYDCQRAIETAVAALRSTASTVETASKPLTS